MALIPTIRNGGRPSGPPHHREVQASPDYTGLLSLKPNNHTDKGLYCNFHFLKG